MTLADAQLVRLRDELTRARQELVKINLDLEKQRVESFRDLAIAVDGLRSPASGIRSAAEYLIEDTSNRLGEANTALLQKVAKSSLFMLRIIEEVLDISTIECGKLKVDPRPTDLASLVRQNLLLNQGQAGRKRIRLEASWEKPAIVVQVDPAKIAQAIDTLVSNAIKFSPDGGRIEVTLGVKGNATTIVVRDEGVGISADRVKTIFDPFRAGRHGDESVKGGIGLGLAISKRIVEGHAGKVEVKSYLGKGSTFTVSLPLA